MPYGKNSIKVKVPNRSGFDKSHRNSGTIDCGTITPILCDEVIPGTRASLRLNLAAQLPPLVSDTYMNCKLKAEAFFVPMRLLCASFEDWFNDFPARVLSQPSQTPSFENVTALLPVADIPGTAYDAGSLMDYLGFVGDGNQVSAAVRINLLPLAAYHLVWQEWYRNPRVQNPAFSKDISNQTTFNSVAYMPSKYFYKNSSGVVNNVYTGNNNFSLADGVGLFQTRQRNFGLDYFTGSRVSAQQGAPSTVSVAVPSGSTEGTMSIAALRAANSLQMFRERNNIPSPRFVDQLRARYGVSLSDGVAQRPICIGSASYDIGTNGINQTAPDGAAPGVNPFSGVGAQYGRAFAAGSDFIINDFTANEPGYILVNITLVPEVTYASGINPMFKRYIAEGSIVEMANPLLQNVGDEPIYSYEVSEDPSNTNIFGYQDRYSKFMFLPNIAHGLFRENESLDSFVLKRTLSGSSQQSSAFLTIPKDYLDPVMTVASATSGLSAWYDCLLDYRVSMPLYEFSIPSLQDPAYEHGKTISLHRNGQIF